MGVKVGVKMGVKMGVAHCIFFISMVLPHRARQVYHAAFGKSGQMNLHCPARSA